MEQRRGSARRPRRWGPGDHRRALELPSAPKVTDAFSTTGKESTFDDYPCAGGCAVQKIDTEKRAVVAQQVHDLSAREVLFVRSDPSCRMAVVGYRAPPPPATPSSYDYRVDLLDYLPSQ